MAEKSKSMERSGSISSSTTATSRQEEISLEKMDPIVNSAVSSLVDANREDKEFETRDSLDLERASEGLLAAEEDDGVPVVKPEPKSQGSATLWMIVNTLATIGIVSLLLLSKQYRN